MKKDFLIYVETLDKNEINRLEELIYMSKAEEERQKNREQTERKIKSVGVCEKEKRSLVKHTNGFWVVYWLLPFS